MKSDLEICSKSERPRYLYKESIAEDIEIIHTNSVLLRAQLHSLSSKFNNNELPENGVTTYSRIKQLIEEAANK